MMPEFSFRGFTAGSQVAVSAAQGADGASNSITNWGQGLASLDILTVHSGALVAPCGVWFDVVNIAGFDVNGGPGPGEIYDPSFHEITYTWDFGDPGQFTTPLNMPAAWNDRNLAYGKQVAHVFNDPGTYSVRVRAVDRAGTSAEKTISITIADPDAVYAGARTICYSSTGDFAGAPPGAQQVTTAAGIETALENLGQTGRVLFKRGQTSVLSLTLGDSVLNGRFGAFGAGPPPSLYPAQAAPAIDSAYVFRVANDCPATDFCFHDLDLRGRWNADRETGDPRDTAFAWFGHQLDGHFVIHRCRMDGLGTINFTNLAGRAPVVIFNDCDRTNWQDYGFYANPLSNPEARVAFCGVSAHQHADACLGEARDGLSNQQGPVRLPRIAKVYIGASDFFSRNGWTKAGPFQAAQPCLRLNSTGTADQRYNLERVACEGGFSLIDADGEGSSTALHAGNYLFDKMLLVGSAQTQRFVAAGFGGLTLRNVIAVMPSVVEYCLGVDRFFDFAAGNPQPGNYDTPVALYSCTGLNLQPAARNNKDNVALQTGIDAWTLFTEWNNVLHAPVQLDPAVSDAPIDTASQITGFAPRFAGARPSLEKPPLSLPAPVVSGGTVTVPYPAGTAQGDFPASGLHTARVHKDYYFSDLGQIAVSFGASDITVTNLSGATWDAGLELRLGLDRGANHVTDTTYASPAGVPLPRPLPDSPAIGGEVGFAAHDDALGAVRPTPATRGALEPV